MRILKISFVLALFYTIGIFAKSETKPSYFLANVDFHLDNVKISQSKFDAAATYAIAISEKYYYFSMRKRDSVIKELNKEKIQLTGHSIGKKLNANYALFANVNQSENLLRVDLTAVDLANDSIKYSGIGWSLIKFKSTDNDSIIVDPSLLEAFQRAFAVLTNDSNLFENQNGALKVFPKTPIVLCALNYKESEFSEKWKIYKDRITDSYDALVNIFEIFYANKKYLPLDIETRDFLYQKNNLLGVENYSSPSKEEISLLSKLGINNFIFGEIEFNEDKMNITLYLCEVKDNNISQKSSATGELEKDGIVEFRNLIKELSQKLEN